MGRLTLDALRRILGKVSDSAKGPLLDRILPGLLFYNASGQEPGDARPWDDFPAPGRRDLLAAPFCAAVRVDVEACALSVQQLNRALDMGASDAQREIPMLEVDLDVWLKAGGGLGIHMDIEVASRVPPTELAQNRELTDKAFWAATNPLHAAYLVGYEMEARVILEARRANLAAAAAIHQIGTLSK